MKLAIVILAAGASRRMGSPKQLLDWGTKTLVGHCVSEALQAKSSGVYVVLGANSGLIEQSIANDSVKIIKNTNWEKGLSSSIVCAITKVALRNYDAVLIMLADQPEVDFKYLTSLIDQYKLGKTAIVATAYSNKNGVPAIFNQKYFKDLQKLKGDRGASHIIDNNKNDTHIIIPERYLNDIDTPEAYKKLFQFNFNTSIQKE